MSDADIVISMRNVVKSFGDQVVLDGVTFDVRRGETVVIMGGSGCGKSTTLRHLVGSLNPDEGSVEVLGRDIATLNETVIGVWTGHVNFDRLDKGHCLHCCSNLLIVTDGVARDGWNRWHGQIANLQGHGPDEAIETDIGEANCIEHAALQVGHSHGRVPFASVKCDGLGNNGSESTQAIDTREFGAIPPHTRRSNKRRPQLQPSEIYRAVGHMLYRLPCRS